MIRSALLLVALALVVISGSEAASVHIPCVAPSSLLPRAPPSHSPLPYIPTLPSYCNSGPTSAADSLFGRIWLTDDATGSLLIDYTPVCSGTSGPTGLDFRSNIVANLKQGSSYTLRTKYATCSGFYRVQVAWYIDFDTSEAFGTAAPELIFTDSGVPDASITSGAQFTVPTNLAGGSGRMRLVLLETSSSTIAPSCGTYQYGHTIDFGITIDTTCSDGFQNGDEQGVDCGGSTCGACPCPQNSLDGNVWPATAAGQTATLACPATYSGSKTRTCTGPAWQAVSDTCTAPPCPADSGFPETLAGARATLDCGSGVGNNYRDCSFTGNWQTIVYSCQCAADGDWPATAVNTQAADLSTCPGANEEGIRRRFCGASGAWEAETSTCAVPCPLDGVWPKTVEDTLVELPCPATATTGTKTRYCNIGGTWAAEEDSCRDPCPADGFHPSTDAGQKSVLVCEPGTIGGVWERQCNSEGAWEAEVKTCFYPPCYAEGDWAETPPGGSATAECLQDQLGSRTRECGAEGDWAAPVNTCYYPPCPADGPWAETPADQVASISCDQFETLGSHTRICAFNGAWEAPNDTCQVPDCPALPDCPATAPGATCNIGCESYETLGSNTRDCDATGTWGAAVTTCAAPDCPLDGIWVAASPDTTASVDCDQYEILGTHTRVCDFTGAWEDAVDTCAVPDCPTEGVWTTAVANTTASIACPDRYVGANERKCDVDGAWLPATNTCEPPPCAEDNGWAETAYGELANKPCGMGEIGSLTRQCSSVGLWQDEVNSCDTAPCPADGQWSVTAAGTRETQICPVDTTGELYRDCDENGAWATAVDTCVPDCLADGVWSQISAGLTAFRPCPARYSGQNFRQCDATGTWVEEVNTCAAPNCPPVSDWPSTAPGANTTLPCESYQTGDKFRQCASTGSWEAVINNCVTPSCVAEDGWATTAPNSLDSKPCQPGQQGQHTRFCSNQGQWQAPENTCFWPNCQATADFASTAPGATATHTGANNGCLPDEEGARTRTCSPEGVWSAVVSTCAVPPCAQTGEWGLTAAGGTAVADCQQYYVGQRTRLCPAAGRNFEAIVDNCVLQACPASQGFDETTAGSTATQACPAMATSGTWTRQCSAQGFWEPAVKTCSSGAGAQCDADGDWAATGEGSRATVDCPMGYTGLNYRNCGVGGVWEPSVNGCRASDCLADSVWRQASPGETLSYACEGEQGGKLTRKCGLNGVFEPVFDTCFDLDASPCAADMDHPQTAPGRTSALPCPANEVGYDRRRCSGQGVWEARDRTCALPDCPAESYAGVDGSTVSWTLAEAGTQQSQPCADLWEGSRTRSCNSVGRWEPVVGTCTIIPTCVDGVKNGDEEDVDCGGPECDACPTCSDELQNGDETGVDCGGACGVACPTCNDGLLNQGEEQVDCGGPCTACPSCSDGLLNQGELEADCSVAVGQPCTRVCPSISCFNGVADFEEEDVDCGGPDCVACPTCSDGILNGGEDGVDCGLAACGRVCLTCFDNIKNQGETSRDCGGPNCPACSSCDDGVLNGIEAGIDCGGSCRKCNNTMDADVIKAATFQATFNFPDGDTEATFRPKLLDALIEFWLTLPDWRINFLSADPIGSPATAVRYIIVVLPDPFFTDPLAPQDYVDEFLANFALLVAGEDTDLKGTIVEDTAEPDSEAASEPTQLSRCSDSSYAVTQSACPVESEGDPTDIAGMPLWLIIVIAVGGALVLALAVFGGRAAVQACSGRQQRKTMARWQSDPSVNELETHDLDLDEIGGGEVA